MYSHNKELFSTFSETEAELWDNLKKKMPLHIDRDQIRGCDTSWSLVLKWNHIGIKLPFSEDTFIYGFLWLPWILP